MYVDNAHKCLIMYVDYTHKCLILHVDNAHKCLIIYVRSAHKCLIMHADSAHKCLIIYVGHLQCIINMNKPYKCLIMCVNLIGSRGFMFYPLFVVFYRNFITVDWVLKTNHLFITDTSVSSRTSHFNFGSLWCAGGRFVRDIYWIAVFCGLVRFHKLITFSGTAQ